ncbi:MAG: hypothetical protein ISS59_00955 [Desulfobacteraceae bacterium]|nr:hypothetical protein [Desulfobacteraceae bacterium]
MDQIIERLKTEKAEVEVNLFDQGKNDGLMWAKEAHYLDIQSTLEWNPGNGDLPDQAEQREEVLNMIHDDPDLGFEANSWQMDEKTTEWAKGFVDGVQDFWDQARNKTT